MGDESISPKTRRVKEVHEETVDPTREARQAESAFSQLRQKFSFDGVTWAPNPSTDGTRRSTSFSWYFLGLLWKARYILAIILTLILVISMVFALAADSTTTRKIKELVRPNWSLII